MSLHNPKPLFDAIRALHGRLSQEDVNLINRALVLADNDEAVELVPTIAAGRFDVSPSGIAAMKRFEGCALKAYPDPGSRDGGPWTIGFGATGPGISEGTVWTQEQADARFMADLRRFENLVEAALGNAPTSQQQFDAITSITYNIGIGSLRQSTLLRRHKAGDFAAATDEFGRWIYNDGKLMKGLRSRRAKEAAIYREGKYP